MSEIERAANPTTEEAIKYLERMLFTQDFSPSTLRAKAVNTMAIEALREKAEREKGCGFCCYQEYPDKTLHPKEGYAFYAGFSKQMAADAFDETETDGIKFCPMCGRRLEAQHEQN